MGIDNPEFDSFVSRSSEATGELRNLIRTPNNRI
jgi:hypothetical protein